MNFIYRTAERRGQTDTCLEPQSEVLYLPLEKQPDREQRQTVPDWQVPERHLQHAAWLIPVNTSSDPRVNAAFAMKTTSEM